MSVRDDADLRELFLEEARERLERVIDLVVRIDSDSDAIVGLRRQLHALKGASRMMGFTEISDLCHRAEDLAERDAAASRTDRGSFGSRSSRLLIISSRSSVASMLGKLAMQRIASIRLGLSLPADSRT